MAPLSAFIVSYPVDHNAMGQYRRQRNLDGPNVRPFVQHLESEAGVPVVLARVDDDDAPNDSRYYICCFADYSGHTYSAEELSSIPIPATFERLPELLPGAVAGDLKKFFAPRTMLFSYDSAGRSRVDDHGALIGTRTE